MAETIVRRCLADKRADGFDDAAACVRGDDCVISLAMCRVEKIIHEGIEAGLHPGAQAYVSIEGKPVLDVAAGEARPGVAMERDTLTLWMSAGKPVAAIAMLQLFERGAVTPDTTAASILPEFAANGKSTITLRHILTHTAGFRGPLNNFTTGSFAEVVARVCQLRLEPGWTPGERAGYHIGSSWFILGAVIETLSGRPFDRYVRDRVFAPLDIDDAYVGMSDAEFDAVEPRLASMFVTEKGTPDETWPGNGREATCVSRPGANARGPIRALAKVYESIAFDERLLSRRWCDEIGKRHRAGMVDQTFKQTIDWGLGVMVDSKHHAGEHQYGFGPLASSDTFGHSGNQSSCAFYDPRHRLVAAWTCNGMPGEPAHQARARQINRAIYEEFVS
jgi:CubicO group peptidase (beta-lactamase class C family)